MFIMVHDLELPVGGQVHLEETWALITTLQRCSKDREISLPQLIRLGIYKHATIYLADGHCVSA